MDLITSMRYWRTITNMWDLFQRVCRLVSCLFKMFTVCYGIEYVLLRLLGVRLLLVFYLR